jgi:hypothetical protein
MEVLCASERQFGPLFRPEFQGLLFQPAIFSPRFSAGSQNGMDRRKPLVFYVLKWMCWHICILQGLHQNPQP